MKLTLYSHMLTSRYGVPLMIANNNGLIVEVTDASPIGEKCTANCRKVSSFLLSTCIKRRRYAA